MRYFEIEVLWNGKVIKNIVTPEGYKAREALNEVLRGIELDPGLSINIKESANVVISAE